MSLMLIICKVFLLALSVEILKINTVSCNMFPEGKNPSSSVFSEIKFPLKNFDLKEIFSMFHMRVSHLKAIYLEDLKHVVLNIDEFASKLYKQMNTFIQNPHDLLSHFKLNKFSWNWKLWAQDFSYPAFNFSGKLSFLNRLFQG